MKKFVLILIVIVLGARLYSQTITATTWYIIPPTSGCNGIWAIDASVWPCFTSGCSYSAASPFGCLTSTFPTCDSIVGDTLYLPLCSTPCNIAASCGPGPVVICGTPPPMTTSIVQETARAINSFLCANKVLSIENLKPDDEIEIYDISGRQVFTEKCEEFKKVIHLQTLSENVYILLIRSKENEIVYRKKLALIQ